MGDPALTLRPSDHLFTEEEYLSGLGQEEETNYEFVNGRIYAMSTPTDTHSFISGAIFAALFAHLKGRPCRVFKGDMKLRINFLQHKVHYIPDVMVACDREPKDRRFREEPLLLVEVLSQSTRATDEREKLFSYTAIGHLKHYVVVEQDEMRITHYQRGDAGWSDALLTEPTGLLRLPELDFQMSVADIYAEVDLSTLMPSRRVILDDTES